MTDHVLSPLARADLDEIWNYTENRWNVIQAERYVRQLVSAMEAIAEDPAIGRACDEVRAGYFRYKVGSHIVFYRLRTTGIEVVRILHERRDFDRVL